MKSKDSSSSDSVRPFVVPALAQTTPSNATNVANPPDWFIVGHGTAGSIPLFVAPFKLADSTLFQTQNGNLGLGTVTPVSTFNVVNNETSNNQFGLQPYGIYGTLNNSAVNFSAAIRGDSMATTGGGNGVIGLTSWERDVVLCRLRPIKRAGYVRVSGGLL